MKRSHFISVISICHVLWNSLIMFRFSLLRPIASEYLSNRSEVMRLRGVSAKQGRSSLSPAEFCLGFCLGQIWLVDDVCYFNHLRKVWMLEGVARNSLFMFVLSSVQETEAARKLLEAQSRVTGRLGVGGFGVSELNMCYAMFCWATRNSQ